MLEFKILFWFNVLHLKFDLPRCIFGLLGNGRVYVP